MPLRRSVSVKFAAAVGVVVLGVVCVALIGANGLVQLRSDIERLTLDDLSDVRAVDDLAIGVYSAREAALAELAARSPRTCPAPSRGPAWRCDSAGPTARTRPGYRC